MSPDGSKCYAKVQINGSYQFLDLHSGATIKAKEGPITHAYHPVFSPDGSQCYAIVWINGSKQYLDLHSGETIKAKEGNITGAQDPVFSPDGSKCYARVAIDVSSQLLNLTTGKLLTLGEVLPAHVGEPVVTKSSILLPLKLQDGTWGISDVLGKPIPQFRKKMLRRAM